MPSPSSDPGDTRLPVVPDASASHTCVPGAGKANRKYLLNCVEFIFLYLPFGSNNQLFLDFPKAFTGERMKMGV